MCMSASCAADARGTVPAAHPPAPVVPIVLPPAARPPVPPRNRAARRRSAEPRSRRRPCDSRLERQYRGEGMYPLYYVNHVLTWYDDQGRERYKQICDDCHNVFWLEYERRWSREQGYGRQDGVAATPAELAADAPPDPDRSPSGEAIGRLRNAVVHDEQGEPAAVELVEAPLPSERTSDLVDEIKSTLSPADFEAWRARYAAAAGVKQLKPITV
jgi:hypothetical protein